ncbi:MAG: glycosyltransferase family 4 protein [Thermoplasmatota archaeon]
MSERPRVALASQTPPVRFRVTSMELAERYPDLAWPLDVGALVEGEDFVWTTGGVPIMLRQLLAASRELGAWSETSWVNLNPAAPREYTLDATRIRSVSLEAERLRRYGVAKEKMWSELHGLAHNATPSAAEFEAFTAMNFRTAHELMEVLPDADVAFVHDFQLAELGTMVGLSAPTVLRWHIPFTPERWNPYFRRYFVRALESFDAVIVSCRRDLEGLVRSGYRGLARQVYPYLDLTRAAEPATPAARDAFAARVGVTSETPVILCVARMDPIKGQDRLIEAMRRVVAKIPDAKLVLVGNGSFTSASTHGLGHPKGARWRETLTNLVAARHLGEHVVFTGYLPPDLLDAAWERANVVAQPSAIEGFGLTAIEAWLREKPVVVSRGAGASELVLEGVNGYTYDPTDDEALAGHLLTLLADGSGAAKMGRRGRESTQRCALEAGARAETAVLCEAIDRFGVS